MKQKLFLFFALACGMLASPAHAESSWTAPAPQASTLTSGNSYYLYNNGAGKFLGQGNFHWGTNAVFADTGLLLTLSESSGVYTLTNGDVGKVFWDGTYLYVDGSSSGDAYNFTFASAGNGTYTIHGGWTETGAYVGYSGGVDDEMIWCTLTGTYAAEKLEWTLVSAEEYSSYQPKNAALWDLYRALLLAEELGFDEAATTASASYNSSFDASEIEEAAQTLIETIGIKDVTSTYIQNSYFPGTGSASATTTGWTINGFTSQSSYYLNSGAYCDGYFYEKWCVSSSSLDDASISQTISSLPEGTYRLQADAIATLQADANTKPTGVYLYAGEAQTEVATSNSMPEHFTVDFTMASTGNITIGFKTSSTNTNWVAVDNFKLYDITDYTPTTTVEDRTSLITNPDASDGVNGWTATAGMTTMLGEHWSAHGWQRYFEMSSDEYGSTGYWQESMSQTLTNPGAGVYKLTAAGRSAEYVRLTMLANDIEYVFPADGNYGGTIATDGTEWPDLATGIDNAKNFARADEGYGWNWGSIEVIVEDSEDLTIGMVVENTTGAQYQWGSLTDLKLEYLGATTDANLDKEALADAIADVEAMDITTNVGDGAFEIPTSYATAITSALSTANSALESSPANADDIIAAYDALRLAAHNFENATLNVPKEGEMFNIIMAETNLTDYYQKCVTFYTGENVQTEMGNYNLGYVKDKNEIYGQIYTFTSANDEDMPNGYTISFTDVDGNTRYLCLGTVYTNGTAAQIRTTTDSSNAFVFDVVRTTVSGAWRLYNSDAKEYVGSTGDEGFYTDGRYTLLSLTAAEPMTYEAKFTPGTPGYATICLPFAAALPDDVTACSPTVSGDEVVTTATVNTLAANTPYLLMGEGGGTATFTGTGTYYDTYDLTNGVLTGVIAEDETAEEGVYVLQSHEGEVAFYLVTENSGTVTVPQYHAYLTTEEGEAGAKAEAFILVPGNTTGIEAVEAAETDSETIYDLSGRKVSKAQKGVYIKGGKKVIIK